MSRISIATLLWTSVFAFGAGMLFGFDLRRDDRDHLTSTLTQLVAARESLERCVAQTQADPGLQSLIGGLGVEIRNGDE